MLRKTRPIEKRRRRWVEVNLSGSRFHNVDLTGSSFTGVLLDGVSIDGHLGSLTVNGVEVAPLVQAALEERHPERALIGSRHPAELREGWAAVKAHGAELDAVAAGLGKPGYREQVDDEWSYLETLRHLVMVTDSWLGHAVLRRNDYWPAGLLTTDMPPWYAQSCGLDPSADPSPQEVLKARDERLAMVDDFLADLTEEALDQRCPRPRAKGYPAAPQKYTVGQCLHIVLDEWWAHQRFAARDLAILSERARGS